MNSFNSIFNNYIGILNRFPAILSFTVLCFTFVIFSFALGWLWKNVLIRFADKTSTNLDKYIFSSTHLSARLVFIAAGLNFSWKLYGKAITKMFAVIEAFDIEFVGNLFYHVFYLILAFSITLFLWNVIFSIIHWYEKDIARKTESRLDEKIIPTIRKIFKVVFLIVLIMMIASHFGKPLSGIWAAAGIGSLAVAFAAKDTLANIISGVIILMDRPFLLGDRIELSDGTFGDVVEIGIRSTKILSFDNTIYILPNAEISNKRITNHAYPDFKIKIRHKIGVAYGTEIEKVKAVINDILEKNPNVLNNPEWGVYFMEFGDSSLDFMVIYWVSDYTKKFEIIDKINTEINNRFNEEKIVIPFPQRDVYLKK
ncbi:mechanosensitive ion channel family protein [Candidatus Latescibacterota bacterium]